MRFSPIAIIGQGCVLPGALDIREFSQVVREGRIVTSAADAALWGVAPEQVLSSTTGEINKACSSQGGYISGFEERFTDRALLQPKESLQGDVISRWLVDAGRQALESAGFDDFNHLPETGVIMGNLSYPTYGYGHLATIYWLSQQKDPQLRAFAHTLQSVAPSYPMDRFSTGMPIKRMARALGCRGPAFALDAACASSLYAIKLACDRLHDGRAEMMLAGAVNRADSLFLNIGFSSLSALSASGRSMPFQSEADGLVPAQGAAVVALARLDEAEANGWPIKGLIRGIGLGNDGARGGMLSPSAQGQIEAISRAYEDSPITPADISLIECHATGTQVGDRIELESIKQVFKSVADLPIGSLKANTGHLITAAGGAGLLKVLQAFEHQVRPATPVVGTVLDELQGGAIRLLDKNEPWPEDDKPRRAGINAFGFGGNNAHMVVEEWRGGEGHSEPFTPASRHGEVTVTASAVHAGEVRSYPAFVKRLLHKPENNQSHAARQVELDIRAIRIPPADLHHTLGQQTLLFETLLEAVEGVEIPRERCGVYVGMGCDPEPTRHSGSWRLPNMLEEQCGQSIPAAWREAFSTHYSVACDAARVLGAMPNIPANRINAFFDIRATGFTVGSEENSGLVALELAQRALYKQEIDMAIVAAVDLSCEPLHQWVAEQVLPQNRHIPGDAAVVLILQRAEPGDETRSVVLTPQMPLAEAPAWFSLVIDQQRNDLGSRFGHAHAASGLLHVAAAVAGLQHGIALQPGEDTPTWLPHTEGVRHAQVMVEDMSGERAGVCLRSSAPCPAVMDREMAFEYYAATDRAGLIEKIELRQCGGEGSIRAAIVCQRCDIEARRQSLVESLQAGGTPGPEEGFFADKAIEGEVAIVLNGSAAAYAGCSEELLLAVPSLYERLSTRCHNLLKHLSARRDVALTPMQQLHQSTLIHQLHSEWVLGIAGLKVDACVGLSSGETNGLFALGAWQDIDLLFERLDASELYTTELTNEVEVVAEAWRSSGAIDAGVAIDFTAWRLLHPVDEVVKHCQAYEPLLRVSVIHTDGDCLIIGQRARCTELIAELKAYAIPLGLDIAVHSPDIIACEQSWYDMHNLSTKDVGVRFYANAINDAYTPERDKVAGLLTGQAINSIDFRPTVRKAYADGVRVFVELGPRDLCSRWISDILKDPSVMTVSMDRSGEDPFSQALNLVARLWCHQVAVDIEAVARLLPESKAETGQAFTLTVATRSADVVIPPLEIAMQKDNTHIEFLPTAPPLGRFARMDASTLAEQRRKLPALDTVLQAQLSTTGSIPLSPQTPQADSLLDATRQMHDEYMAGVRRLAQTLEVSMEIYQQTMLGLMTETGDTSVAGTIALEEARTTGLPGPKWDRDELITLSSGKISSLFGPLFEQQDGYRRQVRMPMPPLLLADRVTGLDAVAGSMGKGRIWTETDVSWDSWYLHHGHMPAGIMVESGQADLLLISYLGADFHNQDQRVYRLLGCDLTYHSGLPRAGETLSYDIHVDGHAEHDGIRLFFFHYDCHVGERHSMSVRNGQAGFFSDEELAQSEGVLWQPQEIRFDPAASFDAPRVAYPATEFSRQQIRDFAAGDLPACFGPEFAAAVPHTRSPAISQQKMLLLDRVTRLDHQGGPVNRGYLQAELSLKSDHWFYHGHFKHDPCMPGTLMAEGCLQAMAFYLASLGYSLDKDGWRFEPVPDVTFKLRCRGQATPVSQKLVYEIFVTSVIDGPRPQVIADVLVSVDGLKAFHGEGMALQLVPGWPLEGEELLVNDPYADRVAHRDDIHGSREAMLACALGRPSQAFGRRLANYDSNGLPVPRLPGPPYLFISRITQMPEQAGTKKPGGHVSAEFDIQLDDWFFKQNGAAVMPYCVLLEAALQPCGWLASFNIAGTQDDELSFRNLDGSGTVQGEVLPTGGVLTTRVDLTQVSESAGMIIVGFDVHCQQDQRPIYRFNTVFGFFPAAALAVQAGVTVDEAERECLAREGNVDIILNAADKRSPYFAHHCRLAGERLLMLDRISGFWPQAGEAGLGSLRSYKRVDAHEWFFKAHFFQDSVQPGSLGIEAMLQLLQFYMLHTGMHEQLPNGRFEAIALEQEMAWKYRGQVTPNNERIEITMQITDRGEDDKGVFAIAKAVLWVDGLPIYSAEGLGMRIVAGQGQRIRIDPQASPWLNDHRPTYSKPAMPLMGIADMMVELVYKQMPGKDPAVQIKQLNAYRWLLCDEVVDIDYELNQDESMTPPGYNIRFSRGQETIATATLLTRMDTEQVPEPLAPLSALVLASPYKEGKVFHGPAFYYLKSHKRNNQGVSAVFDLGAGTVPVGRIAPGVLDTIFHALPGDRFEDYYGESARGHIAFPGGLSDVRFYRPTPISGCVRCEIRFTGKASGQRTRVYFQLIEDERVWVDGHIELVLLPSAAYNAVPAELRSAFFGERRYIPGARISQSQEQGKVSQLSLSEIRAINWFPQTLQSLYGVQGEVEEFAEDILVAEHVAESWHCPHSQMQWDRQQQQASNPHMPFNRYRLKTDQQGERLGVEDNEGAIWDESLLRDYWAQQFGSREHPLTDVLLAYVRRSVNTVQLEAPQQIQALKGKPVLYLANHQVAIESQSLLAVLAAIQQSHLLFVAKQEHKQSWIGKLIRDSLSYPGIKVGHGMTFFDREDPASFFAVIKQMHQWAGEQGSLFIHVEGTRSLAARAAVEKLSSVILDFAIEADIPIIPVRVAGALPVQALEQRLDFPLNYAKQDLYIGTPVLPAELKTLSLEQRGKRIMSAINHLGPPLQVEMPNPGDEDFMARVKQWQQEYGAEESQAFLAVALLEHCESPLLKKMLAGEGFEGDEMVSGWWDKMVKKLMPGSA